MAEKKLDILSFCTELPSMLAFASNLALFFPCPEAVPMPTEPRFATQAATCHRI